MSTSSTDLDFITMDDKSSWEAVRKYEEYMVANPLVTWASAELRQNHGLTLRSTEGRITLRFKTPNCGFNGGGPIDAVKILERAGFGTKSELEAVIFTQPKVSFSR